MYLLDKIESQMAEGAAFFTEAELLLALRDALTEANQRYGKPGPSRTADAEEAASELALYFHLMSSDFHVINDLTSQPHNPGKKSPPAHFDDEERKKELVLWRRPVDPHLVLCDRGGPPVSLPAPAALHRFGDSRTHSPILRLPRTAN